MRPAPARYPQAQAYAPPAPMRSPYAPVQPYAAPAGYAPAPSPYAPASYAQAPSAPTPYSAPRYAPAGLRTGAGRSGLRARAAGADLRAGPALRIGRCPDDARRLRLCARSALRPRHRPYGALRRRRPNAPRRTPTPPAAALAALSQPAPASASPTLPGPPVSGGSRLYSVHREFGMTPDPAPIPPQFFANTADLSAPETPDVVRSTATTANTTAARANENAARLAATATP